MVQLIVNIAQQPSPATLCTECVCHSIRWRRITLQQLSGGIWQGPDGVERKSLCPWASRLETVDFHQGLAAIFRIMFAAKAAFGTDSAGTSLYWWVQNLCSQSIYLLQKSPTERHSIDRETDRICSFYSVWMLSVTLSLTATTSGVVYCLVVLLKDDNLFDDLAVLAKVNLDSCTFPIHTHVI